MSPLQLQQRSLSFHSRASESFALPGVIINRIVPLSNLQRDVAAREGVKWKDRARTERTRLDSACSGKCARGWIYCARELIDIQCDRIRVPRKLKMMLSSLMHYLFSEHFNSNSRVDILCLTIDLCFDIFTLKAEYWFGIWSSVFDEILFFLHGLTVLLSVGEFHCCTNLESR